MSDEPTITVSLARKINCGNYESAECFVSISGIKQGATEEEIEALLVTGKLGWDVLRGALSEQVKIAMEGDSWRK